MAAYNDWLQEKTVMIDGEPTVLRSSGVTGTLFRVLGVAPALGPGFDESHTWTVGGRATVLSHALWRRLFAGDDAKGDEAIVGREIELDGVPHRIVGVMPPGFDFPMPDAELWVNVAWDPALRQDASFRRSPGARAATRHLDEERTTSFYRELVESARSLPGIESVGLSSRLPFSDQRWTSDFVAAGWPADHFGIDISPRPLGPACRRGVGAPLGLSRRRRSAGGGVRLPLPILRPRARSPRPGLRAGP